MNIFQCVIFVCVLDSECFGKTISEVMACTGLKSFSIVHQGLDGVSSLSTCKFLFICLLAFNNRNCKNFLTEICIDVQHLDGTLLSFLCCCMCCMSFLPQELSGTKERTCCFLPANNRAPLIVNLRKVSVGLDLFLVEIAEQSLGSRTYAKSLLKQIKTAMSYPCNLRGKTFYMIFLFIKKRLRDKDRHVNVLYTGFFKSAVKLMLDILPDRITCRFDRHTALNTCIATKLSLLNNVCIPLSKILIHRRNGLY